MVSVLVCVWCGMAVGVLLSCSVQWCGAVCVLPCLVCGGEYCGRVMYCLVAVSCGAVRGECVCVLFVWWGIL